ncbi:DUF4880 domain-containing protein [Paraburkholderia phenoliruptrix]|uniref:DUF4880 domain-containing protein n=1 Tax=Paraburkholderia phenoliruptrix TaxID=252970 RepID=UPI002869C797|nr:DUF4880 domain-containing protein [Paraburkholderia phenoliruptrix]WMY12670.1 DUF4880 domain-containing protein [Paraburkholderia phenoliruptrix]
MLLDKLTPSNAPDTLAPAMQAAVEWEVRLRAEEVSQVELKQFEAWRRADPSHDHAWARLQERLGRFSALQGAPGEAVRRALQEPSPTRRRVLKAGAGVAAAVLAGVGTRQLVKVYSLDADYHNADFAPKTVTLNVGVPLTLGAGARVYAAPERPQGNLYLASGQIATDGRASIKQPLTVKTSHGLVRTDSARLSVDALRRHTVVAVQGGDAILSVHGGNQVRASDGSAWSLSHSRIARMPETSADIFSWTAGTLVVMDRAVPDVLETVGRYYDGFIRFPDSAMSRRVSGVFPLDDPTAALRQLAGGLGLSLAFYGKALAVASEV